MHPAVRGRCRRRRRGGARQVLLRPDGAVTREAGGGLRRIQTGRVQNYALGIAIGLIVMAGSFLIIVSR